MKKMLMLFLSLHIFISLPAFSEAKGYLFIIGGGTRPETMMKKFVKLADKFNSGKIIVFPMASSVPDEVGSEQAEQLKRFGAREVEYHILAREQALKVENTGILDEVVGEGNVVVYDASQAQIRISPSLSISGSDIVMHILSSGDRFSLKTKEVMR